MYYNIYDILILNNMMIKNRTTNNENNEIERLKKDKLKKAKLLWIIWWTLSLIERTLRQETGILTWIEAWIKQWWYTFTATFFTLTIYHFLKNKQISPIIANSLLSAFSLWGNYFLQQDSWWTVLESIFFWWLTFIWILIHENEKKINWVISNFKNRLLHILKK